MHASVDTSGAAGPSRRAVLAGGATLAAALAAGGAAAAQEAQADLVSFRPRAMAFDASQNRFTLRGVSPVTLFFSDRPERIAGNMKTEAFVPFWSQGSDSFLSDPPNADLSIIEDGMLRQTVVELAGSGASRARSCTIPFGSSAASMPVLGAAASAFIDIIGMPLTPVSYQASPPWLSPGGIVRRDDRDRRQGAGTVGVAGGADSGTAGRAYLWPNPRGAIAWTPRRRHARRGTTLSPAGRHLPGPDPGEIERIRPLGEAAATLCTRRGAVRGGAAGAGHVRRFCAARSPSRCATGSAGAQPLVEQGPGQFLAEAGTALRPAGAGRRARRGRGRGDPRAAGRLRALLVAEAMLGERITRALILRRVALIQSGHGGPLVIGAARRRRRRPPRELPQPQQPSLHHRRAVPIRSPPT